MKKVAKHANKKTRLPSGPTKETLKQIAKAATLQATGKTRTEIAAELGVKLSMIAEWRKVYRDWWDKAFNRAVEQQAEFINAIKGTEEALKHARGFIDLRLPVAALIESQKSVPTSSPTQDATLSEFYHTYFKPVCLASTGRLQTANYERALRAWYVFTGDPPLKEITASTLAVFRDQAAKPPKSKRLGYISVTTVNGYLRWVQAVLDKAGPPMRGQRDAAGILNRVPWIRRPMAEQRPPRVVAPELLNQLYAGLVAAEAPKINGFKSSAWWRALIVTAYNTGLRRGTLFGLRVTDVDWTKRTILVRPANNKSRKRFATPLNETTIRHLSAIRTDREFLFPWPHCRRWFDTTFHRLQLSAGIPQSEHFGLHNLRKTLATMLYEASPGAAQIALGHSDSRTTQQHYVAPSAIVARALDALPQPEAFMARKDGAA